MRYYPVKCSNLGLSRKLRVPCVYLLAPGVPVAASFDIKGTTAFPMRPARLNAQVIAALQLGAMSPKASAEKEAFTEVLDELLKALSRHTVQNLRQAYGLEAEDGGQPAAKRRKTTGQKKVEVPRFAFHNVRFRPAKAEVEADATPQEARA